MKSSSSSPGGEGTYEREERRDLTSRGLVKGALPASQLSPGVRGDAALCAHLAGVHSLAAARRLHHGVEALGGAQVTLGQLQVVLLLGLQGRFQVLLLPVLQELQLLCRCSEEDTSTQPVGNKEGNVSESGSGAFVWNSAELSHLLIIFELTYWQMCQPDQGNKKKKKKRDSI